MYHVHLFTVGVCFQIADQEPIIFGQKMFCLFLTFETGFGNVRAERFFKVVTCLQQGLQSDIFQGESTRTWQTCMVLPSTIVNSQLPSTFTASCNPQQTSFPRACPLPFKSMQILSALDVCEQKFTGQGHPDRGTTSCALS